MKLTPDAFDRTEAGDKTIELRLNDEKRSVLRVGDVITFQRLPSLDRSLNAKVLGLIHYKTFGDLYDDVGIEPFGLPKTYTKRRFVKECYDIYSKEDEERYGVLGIRFKLL